MANKFRKGQGHTIQFVILFKILICKCCSTFALILLLFTMILSNPQRLSCDDICGLDSIFVNKDNFKEKVANKFRKGQGIQFVILFKILICKCCCVESVR